MCVPLSLLYECLFALLRVLIKPIDEMSLLEPDARFAHYAIQGLYVLVSREYLPLTDLINTVVKLSFQMCVVFNVRVRSQRDKRFYDAFGWGRVGVDDAQVVLFTRRVRGLNDETRQVLIEYREWSLSVLVEIQHEGAIGDLHDFFELKGLKQLLERALGHYEVIWGLLWLQEPIAS